MPTKRKKILHERSGSDLYAWLELLFSDPLVYLYFGCVGDEPYAQICSLLYYSPDPNQDIESLRELWTLNREEILRARDMLAPELELWAERFDGEGSEAGE